MCKKSYYGFMDNLSISSVKIYNESIKRYEKFHGMKMEELIEEALEEQTQQVPPHLLKIIDRLESFQQYLCTEKIVIRTIKTYMSKIQSIYKKNRVQIPYIEQLNAKKINKTEYIEYKDILTHDEIKRTISHVRLPFQARIMTMIQGGLSNEECEHLTTRAFIDETRKYHQCDDDIEALKWLSNPNNPIIWVTKLIRVKTGKPYYALIGAEAVNTIASAKLYEYELPSNNHIIPDKLLTGHKNAFNKSCTKVSKKLGLGFTSATYYTDMTDNNGNIIIPIKQFNNIHMISEIDYEIIKNKKEVIIHTNQPNTMIEYKLNGNYRLRPHMLRKFHATYIRGAALTYEEQSFISNAEIDELQGRGKTNVQDTYIKSNPVQQKLIYAKVMNNVSLYHEYTYELVDGDVKVFLKDQILENKKLEKKVNELEKKLKKKENASKEVEKIRESYGDDVVLELINGILNAS